MGCFKGRKTRASHKRKRVKVPEKKKCSRRIREQALCPQDLFARIDRLFLLRANAFTSPEAVSPKEVS